MDAYGQGFVKVCEARGIDPQELLKSAGIGQTITEGAGKAWKGIKRYGEQLTGSKLRKIEKSKPNFGHLSRQGDAIAAEKSKVDRARIITGASAAAATGGGLVGHAVAKKDK